MARGAGEVRSRLLTAAFWIALAVVVTMVAAPLAAVALRAETFRIGAADVAAIRFTLTQAVLSAALSVLAAVPVARALARRSFPGRALLVAALGAPFLLPVIVAVLGLLAIFGQNGLVNRGIEALGLPGFSIYGLSGVVIAHVFFNLPLAARLLLQGWRTIPAEQFRLAASLSFPPSTTFRLLEWPMLRRTAPGAFMVAVLLCLTSFATVLALGGGPAATTIELAIYQAFRLDFDLGRAALLALVQIALGLGLAMAALGLTGLPQAGAGLDRPIRRWDTHRDDLRLLDTVFLVVATLFLMLPLAAVAVRGAPALAELPPQLTGAVLRSLAVAAGATALTLALALPLALGIGLSERGGAARLADALSAMAIAASPLVAGTGLFLLLNPVADPIALALPVTAVVNALMALPFALRALVPAVRETRRFDRLADSLGLRGIGRLRLVVLPRLRRPLGFALGLAAALSVGDLGVVALFADPEAGTLPLLMYRLMGAYRMDQAAGVALVLVALAFALFWLFDRGGRLAEA
jgi:thiamine transport system permease protein